jgi:hypothetical protein
MTIYDLGNCGETFDIQRPIPKVGRDDDLRSMPGVVGEEFLRRATLCGGPPLGFRGPASTLQRGRVQGFGQDARNNRLEAGSTRGKS